MSSTAIGWICLALGVFYAVGLLAFPSLFRNSMLCPRWGSFGNRASRLSGVGGGLAALSFGFINLNAEHAFAPEWLPWGALAISFIVVLAGMGREPFFTGSRPN